MVQQSIFWIYTERKRNQYLEDVSEFYVHHSIVTRAERNNLSFNGLMDKENVVCIYKAILFSLKNEGNPAICTMKALCQVKEATQRRAAWSQLQEESKEVEPIEAESREMFSNSKIIKVNQTHNHNNWKEAHQIQNRGGFKRGSMQDRGSRGHRRDLICFLFY